MTISVFNKVDYVAHAFGCCAFCFVFVIFAGCGFIKSNHGNGTDKPVSLKDIVSSATPMPEVASADADAAPQVHYDVTKRFDDSGEPYLRAGFRVQVLVQVGDHVEVGPLTVQVNDNLEVILPTIGKVDCTGLVLNGLRSRLTSRYGEFIHNPEVTVSFVVDAGAASPWGQVYVSGRVHSEGWFNIPATRDLRVSRAIQMAGGFSTSARKSSICVSRAVGEGKVQKIYVDLTAVGEDGKMDEDILLKAGDAVWVAEKLL